ncbi:MAG: hypothetical protein PHV05_04165 [Candidatus Riflebacteria bacterium]|nr:hypothetical protein [Candidatus Riflebacteria bacterium]
MMGFAEKLRSISTKAIDRNQHHDKAPFSAVESVMDDTKSVEAGIIAAEAVSAKVPGSSELSTTQILEWAVQAEDEAGKLGYKFAKFELQRLISAANEYEDGEKAKFLEIVAELRALQAL